ncbi:MAG TPA: hypothetical protein VI837_00350 [Blastocatellia bacterium]|nr:hypothetical protein [Blastocatellia bacterium]
MISGILTLVIGIGGAVYVGRDVLSGTHIVIIFGILAASVVIYFSFVFGRAARLRAEITKTKKLIEVVSGDKVR